MNCPKCGSQMSLLLFSSVCDRCDPPASVEQSVKAAVEEELVYYALSTRTLEGAEYFLFRTLEAAREARKTRPSAADAAPVRIVFKRRKHIYFDIYFDPDDRSYKPYRVFSSEDHPLAMGLEVYGVWAD